MRLGGAGVLKFRLPAPVGIGAQVSPSRHENFVGLRSWKCWCFG